MLFRLTLLAAVCAAALPAYAETAAPVSEVVVTATRLPAPLDVTPGAYVITQEEIDARQAVFAADVLSTVPGLSLYRNGAFGGITSIRQRGASADKTLVLIDGVPQNDVSQPQGGYDFASLNLADVSRIEILSGPQGSLWGSDAIGGVIAFTTRELDGARAQIEGGSFGTVNGSVGVGIAKDRWAWGVSASGFDTDGISKADKRDGNPEKDGFWDYTVSANGRVALSDRVSIDGRIRFNQNHVETDGYPAPNYTLADTSEYADSHSFTGFARIRADDPLGFHDSLSYSGYDLDRANLGGDFPSEYTAHRNVYRLTTERGEPDAFWGVAAGLERQDSRASLSDGSHVDLDSNAAFVVGRIHPVPLLTASASVRYDDPDSYRSKTTARVGATVGPVLGFSVSAGYGQGFKIPTLSEIACDFCFPGGPSLNLKPEEAEGWDLKLAWRSPDGRFSASATGYRLSVRDQIDFFFDPSDFSFRYVNIDRTSSNGLELQGEAALGMGFKLKANYAYTDAIDRTTGAALLRVPLHQGSAELFWSNARADAALTVRGEGAQEDAGGVRKGFATADLAGSWGLTDHIRLTARIENLTDKHYQEALGYGEPGRAAYIGVRFRN